MQILTVLSLAIPIVLQVCILALMLWRRLWKRFIWFFAYMLFVLLEAVIQLAVSGNHELYFKVYWSTAPVDVGLTSGCAGSDGYFGVAWVWLSPTESGKLGLSRRDRLEGSSR
jgi:hypothetical protein